MNGMSMLILAGLFAASPMVAQERTTADGATVSTADQIMRVAKSLGLEGIMIEQFKKKFMEHADTDALPFDDETKTALADLLISKFDMASFVSEAIVPLVEKHFTGAEVGMIADFMETDLAAKIVAMRASGEEFDVMGMMSDGSVSREEAMEAMQLFMTLGPKLKELEGGSLAAELESAMKTWGEKYFMSVVSEMIQNSSK